MTIKTYIMMQYKNNKSSVVICCNLNSSVVQNKLEYRKPFKAGLKSTDSEDGVLCILPFYN